MKNNKKKLLGKKKNKILSLLLVLLLSVSFIYSLETNAVAMTKPSFDITITKDKEIASVYDDVTITGTITPNDFETEITKKRIVFLLDTSGSMGDSSRLTKAKSATKKFLEELRDNQNVEVAIVTFATAACINPYGYTKNNVRYYDASNTSEYNQLINIVNGLQATGGTNTAEGLRKAKYMLDYKDDNVSDKNLVFMTDGLPTYYPLTSGWNKKIYTTLTSSDAPSRGGTGYAVTQGMTRANYENNEDSRDAAIEIGNLYKGDANIYTIGYSLDKVNVVLRAQSGKPAVNISNYAEKSIKEIHDSMLGSKGKKDKLYYAETNTIEDLFSDIVKEIKEEYKTKEVEIKLDITNTMNIEGDYKFYDKNDNPIEKGIITYKGREANGKIIYSAEPIKFVVKISGEEKGTFDINGSVRIQCPELEYDETIKFGFSVTFSDRVPEIRAELISAKEVDVVPNGQFTMTYKIIPLEFAMDYVPETSKQKELTFYPTLDFDLNSSFAVVNSASTNSLSQSGNLAISEEIPITYIYNSETKTYLPKESETTVSFRLKAINFAETIYFGADNYISYVGVFGQEMQYKIETPSINVFQGSEITHGFYDGKIEDNMPVIDENTEDKILTSGTNRKMAASFIAYNETSAQLILSPQMKLSNNSSIKAYTINDFGNFEEVSVQVGFNGNSTYNIAFNNLKNDLNFIFIVYEIEVPKEQENNGAIKKYNITMNYLEKSKNAIISTKGLEELPELF